VTTGQARTTGEGGTPVRLRTQDLVLTYGDEVVVDGVSVGLQEGRLTAVVGPNGCGKSTLLRALARVHAASSGSVLLDGAELARLPTREAARRVGLLPQSATAPDGLTVSDLVRFGRAPHQGLLRQWSTADAVAVEQALAAADLDGLAERPLETLSGGQRQRAWIAMAVAQDTPVLLLDEPTAALDLGHALEVHALLRRLADEGRTVVVVLHDLSAACRWADVVIALEGGRVLAQGPPAEAVTPQLVRALYGVDCVLVPDPVSGTPIVVPVRRSTPGGHVHRSQADVEVERGERWVTQLASHLGRKAEVEQQADGVLLRLAGGSCLMSSDATGVRLVASAPEAEQLARVQEVVGGHFERFAAKEGVLVRWS